MGQLWCYKTLGALSKALGRRPPTGSKGTTNNPMIPTTGRPGSRSITQGTGVLNSQIKVADRPVTQQGLRGIKTGSKGPNRQVQDRSYYIGLLRGKIQDLNHEVSDMTKEIEVYSQENVAFLGFEKRAEALAAQIKELQGEMADYNTLMDKLNTDTEISTILADCEMLIKKNDQEARNIDAIFSKKQEKESKVEELKVQLESKKMAVEDVIGNMEEDVLRQYQTMTAQNEKIKKDLIEEQAALDRLVFKIDELKEEIAQSPLKQEALQLHQQLVEVTGHMEEWKKTEEETPQQEQERLLQQVKADNLEMGSVEKRISELQDQLSGTQDQLNQVSSDLTHLHGERSDKYKELKKREETMRDFLDTFEATKLSEKEKIENLESNVVIVLDHISQSLSQSEHMPTTNEFEDMQANLAFKQAEKEKSEATTKTLDDENAKLQSDLHKVEDLEAKITTELAHLNDEIEKMKQEIVILGDLEGLHIAEGEKSQLLADEKGTLLQRRSESQKGTKELTRKYEVSKSHFSDNDTYSQLTNLERKWQHHEQNNFVMMDFIGTKQAEGNYIQLSKDVHGMIKDYNILLCNNLSGSAID